MPKKDSPRVTHSSKLVAIKLQTKETWQTFELLTVKRASHFQESNLTLFTNDPSRQRNDSSKTTCVAGDSLHST